MVPVTILPKHIAQYIICVDDEKPQFDTNNWIEKGKLYRLMGFADAINQSDMRSFLIADAETNAMVYPTKDIRGFREDRFIDATDLFTLYLN